METALTTTTTKLLKIGKISSKYNKKSLFQKCGLEFTTSTENPERLSEENFSLTSG